MKIKAKYGCQHSTCTAYTTYHSGYCPGHRPYHAAFLMARAKYVGGEAFDGIENHLLHYYMLQGWSEATAGRCAAETLRLAVADVDGCTAGTP